MIIEHLCKYLRKVRQFAWDNGPSDLFKNVLIQGNEKELIFTCTDGSNGIRQVVQQKGYPILGECCIDVFSFSKMMEKLDPDSDAKIGIGKKMTIKDNRVNFSLPIKGSDQTFNIPGCSEFADIDEKFFNQLNSVMPIVDDQIPIIYNSKQLYYANPRALYYLPTSICPTPFCVDQKYIRKLFVDSFKKIGKNQGQLYLKNDTCEIFIPLFAAKELSIDPIIKIVESEYYFNCKTSVKELVRAYNFLEGLADSYSEFEHSVKLLISKDNVEFDYFGNIFTVKDYIYSHDKIEKISIPISHLKAITKQSFVQSNEYINIKISDKITRMFVVENDSLLFAGGLSRT